MLLKLKQFQEVNKENKELFMLQISVAAQLRDTNTAEEIASRVLKICDEKERFEVLWILADMYKATGNTTNLNDIRKELFLLLEKINENEYVKELYRTRIAETLSEDV